MHDHKPTPDPAGIRPTLEAPSLDEAYRKTEMKSVANSAPRVLRTPAEPRQIGRFAVQGRLGQGGMGVVYAAYDEGLDRRVAVKLLHATIDDPTGHNRLRQEARSLAQLSHPNVVPVYEVGIHENTPYLAMELVEGQTLREWVEAQTRPNIALLAMYLEIGRGLQATHNVGVIHRDFKPDNVLIGDDGRPRIVDFGLARVGPPKAVRPAPVATGQREQREQPDRSDQPNRSNRPDQPKRPDQPDRPDRPSQQSQENRLLTEPGSVMGTPAYMAPEQWRGQLLDARSDQYAFCVALFECLYGQLPFTGSTLASLMTAVLEDAPHPIPPGAQVDTAVHAAILRGLAREPNDRWPAMEPLLQELQTFVDSQLPGFLETSPVVVFKFVAPVFLLLPLVWLGLEWTDVVPYSPRSWLFVSGAQVLVLGSSILALHKPLSALLGHPRIIGLPALAMLFTLGHRTITLATNSSVEAMFIYDFLAFAGVASIVTYLVERTMWPMVALMLGLTVTATVFPSWSPRLWLGFSLGLPLSLLLLVPDPTGKRQKS